MSRLTLVLDSSQIATWSECPQLWHLSYDQSLTTTNEVREDMAMGSYGHKMLELYYNSKALGNSAGDAIDEAMHLKLEEEFPLGQENREKVRRAFDMYWKVYTNDVTVLMGNHTRTIEIDEKDNITESWALNPLVEKGFSYPLLDTPDYLFVLEGRIDLLANNGGTHCFMDHKFQGRKKSLYKKRIQMRNYSLVTGLSLGCYNYIRYHKTIEKDTYERQWVSFNSFEREWWKKELIKMYTQIAHAIHEKKFEQRWNSCEGSFGYPCMFTKVCEERDESVRGNLIEMNFKKKERWNPW